MKNAKSIIMEISKITKKKSNSYELLFDNNTKIILYDDTLIKYNLLSKKEIDNKLFQEISNYNSKLDAYYTSIKLINTKLRTKGEIEQKLIKLGINKTDIKTITDRLTKEGYLNDELYIKCYINDSLNLSLKGPNKIRFELTKLKLPISIINQYLDEIDNEIWISRVDKIISKKEKTNHNLSNMVFKKKLNNYLINMGYSKEYINLDSISIDNEDEILKKEIEKEIKKLSRKYDGEELITKVKYNLYKKGFSISTIDKLLQ